MNDKNGFLKPEIKNATTTKQKSKNKILVRTGNRTRYLWRRSLMHPMRYPSVTQTTENIACSQLM